MINDYKIVFNVTVSHTYFAQDICKGLDFNPSEYTAEIMQRFNLRIGNDKSGFSLYAQPNGSILDFLNYLDEVADQSYFEFEIQSIDPNFYSYTNFPIDWVGTSLYNSEYLANESVDGVVFLKEDLSSSSSQTTNVIRLKVHFNDLIKSHETDQIVSFEIKFQARATQWQYYIINNGPQQFNNLKITGRSNITFEGPKEILLQNEQTALLFSSEGPLIPLSEISLYSFDLMDDAIAALDTTAHEPISGTVVLSGLPNPNVTSFGIVELEGIKQVTSPMYIYV
ncbi:MAG: hypothetical protein K0U54_01240 [Bacteroidetes bacterium]|nr:hypothetical protein [Bacteroidota bacterium]